MQKNDKTKANFSRFIMLIMALLASFSGILSLFLMSKIVVKTTYIASQPVYNVIHKTVEETIYHQESPIIPIPEELGKELVLLDKSGSMKEFVTDIYTNNINFFNVRDIWAFDTEIHSDVTVESLDFYGDTDICKAINKAAEDGYNTIWLCSDLENTAGIIGLTPKAKDLNVIVYSPKSLDLTASQDIKVALKECNFAQIITMS